MVHGLAIGSILYLITKNAPVSIGVGAGAGFYMTRYGHSLPNMTERKPDRTAPHPNVAAFNHTHIALTKKDSFDNWMTAAF
jgi:hypothetical protein